MKGYAPVVLLALATLWLGVQPLPCQAGVVFGNNGLQGGFRWDAAPRTINGLERSLGGGLRYSVQGGSFQAFRDSFSWSGATPTVAAFQSAVEGAFSAWSSVDPVSGLGTSLSFVQDFQTPVDRTVSSSVRLGAEIDLFANDLGDTGLRGFSLFNVRGTSVTLTSGTANYAAAPISGADVTLNANPGARYTLDIFRRLLTHELGHAIGLGDVEGDINPNRFIDDNYDATNSAAVLDTLTNSWAHLVDPLDPSNSPLNVFNVPDAEPGLDTLGVDILMESRGLGVGPNNLLGELVPLSNDDYGTRQFLYPSFSAVPEPSSICLAGLVASCLIFRRSRSS